LGLAVRFPVVELVPTLKVTEIVDDVPPVGAITTEP
jgi:hypothetical protein